MKVLFVKKATLIITILILIFVSVFAVAYNSNLSIGAVYFASNVRKLPIYSVKTQENKLAISFDAAWGADKTREIMAICDAYGIKATFFLVGFWVEKYPELTKEIYNNGFEIGIHSNTHPDMTKLSVQEITNQLKTNMDLIQNLTNFRPKLFRPPYGYYNNDLLEVCESLGLSCIEWSVDSLDWKGLSASQLSGRVISRAKSGDIVLFHNNSDNIIPGLKLVLEHYSKNNINIVPVGDLIYYFDYTIDHAGTQIKK